VIATIERYLVTAYKRLIAEKLYSAINLIGLAVGLACFVLIGLYVQHELGYDRYHAQADRVFRISSYIGSPGLSDGSPFPLAGTPPVLAPLLVQHFAHIERAGRISRCGGGTLVASGDRTFLERQFAAADNDVLSILDFEWLEGSQASALSTPFSIVLTESAARRYFGAASALGQTLTIENQHPVEVTGVIRDLPDNTHLRFDMLVAMGYVAAVNGQDFLNVWTMNCYYTYVLLQPDASIGAIQSQSRDFIQRHRSSGPGISDFAAIPLPDVHLSTFQFEFMSPPGSRQAVYGASAIAVFILMIACINFMNLSTARATRRAREVGVRKSLGAGRERLIAQFIGESVLMALIAMMLAIALVELLLPVLEDVAGKRLAFDYVNNVSTLLSLLLLTLVVGVAAGSYPAFYLSAFSPASVLRGDVTRGTGAATFRKVLVVVQFSITVALVIAAAIVYQQMRFVRDIELGYDREQVVVASSSLTEGFGNRWDTLKREWLGHPQIVSVTRSLQVPGSTIGNFSNTRVEGGDESFQPLAMLHVDHGFFETYDITLLDGRTFSETFATDRLPEAGTAPTGTEPGVILNALAAREYGWTPEEAVGKWIDMQGGPDVVFRARIIGIVEDVHYESMHFPIRPVMYVLSPARIPGRASLTEASIRITGRDLAGTLAYIDATWRRILPEQPITRRFLDQDFQALYVAEERQGAVFAWFSFLAIFIACLGLFGLASFATEQRTKEIGVRKVMGGTVWDIVRLFTGEFGKLVLAANLIGWPIAYVLMGRWLESFAYRIDIGLAVFVAGAMLALAVAVLTVGVVSARAATINPIRSLRYE
jgi:putative ABC transport system permease protein